MALYDKNQQKAHTTKFKNNPKNHKDEKEIYANKIYLNIVGE